MDVEDKPDSIAASRDYFDFGKHHFTISTQSADAQAWFNRGLIWPYSFNHEEAVRYFQQVTLHDPSSAMGYWGDAYASGPNYKASAHRTFEAARQAKALMGSSNPWEKVLIEAIQYRFPVVMRLMTIVPPTRNTLTP